MTAVHLVILGRQGSGKGTQAARLVEAYRPIHVSTGDMLRVAVAAGTELGLQARALMNAGDLVGVSLECSGSFAGFEIPQPHRAISSGGGQ